MFPPYRSQPAGAERLFVRRRHRYASQHRLQLDAIVFQVFRRLGQHGAASIAVQLPLAAEFVVILCIVDIARAKSVISDLVATERGIAV